MAMTVDFETNILKLLFNNTNLANVGDNTGLQGSGSAGEFWGSLHTADPTNEGNQTSNEATYTGYARANVARSTAGWTVSSNTVSNANLINFPTCTAGNNTITHFGVGYSQTGNGTLQFVGQLTSTLAVSHNITPGFTANSLVFTAT